MTKKTLLLLSLLFAASTFADSADLHIVGNVVRHSPARFAITFALLNQGPDVARNTVLQIDVPAGLTIEHFSVGGGEVIHDCVSTARPIRCSLGDLHVGMPFHYGGIDIRATDFEAKYEFVLTLTSDTPDPNTADNRATALVERVLQADLDVQLDGETDRADPGGIATFRGRLCNFVIENVAPQARVEFTATNGSIREVVPAAGFTCTAETPSKTVCTIPEFPNQCTGQPFRISVAASENRGGGETALTMRAVSNVTDENPQNDQETVAVTVYRWLTVTNTADAGEGSLRAAIDEANASCTPGPCRIVFEIPGPVPAAGWFTITPSAPLPAITAARMSLEGNRQTAFTGNTNPKGPEIAIDGRFAHRGIHMLSPCEGVVSGLALGNFDEDQGLWIATGSDCGNRFDRREVVDNHIGVDPSGEVAWPNRRGLRADGAIGLTVSRNVISRNQFSGVWLWRGAATFTGNLIEANGASGLFLGSEVYAAVVADNAIRGNRQMGVAAARDVYSLALRRNEMQDNGGLGIDWGLDGISPTENDHDGPTNAPVLLAATYDAARDRTNITLTLRSEPLGPRYNYGYLEFFSNATPDGDGEEYIGTYGQVFQMQGTTTASVPGDHRGRWINATWTREHLPYATTPEVGTENHDPGFMVMSSELSNAVRVE